jgi:hypothetical protein
MRSGWSDKDGELSPHVESRGPMMSASANSNRTAAFDESSGILGFVSRHFRRSQKRKNKSHEVPNPDQSKIVVLVSQTGSGSGAVACANGDDSSSSSSSSRNTGENSIIDADGVGGTRMAKSADNSTLMFGRAANSTLPASQSSQQAKESTTAGNISASAENGAVGSGRVRVAPSSSASASASTNSSDTEYAPPSTGGEDNDKRRNSATALPPPSAPPTHALLAGEAAGKAASGVSAASVHDKVVSASRRSEVVRDRSRSDDSGKHLANDAKSALLSSLGDRRSSSSSSASSSTTTTSSSDSDDADDDDDSVGRAYSKMTDQSEGASSRVPFSNSGVRRHTLASPSSATFYAASTRDVRSSLVSTIDVDVAVVQEQRRQRQHQLYLQAALHRSVGPPSAATRAASASPPIPLTRGQSSILQQRADAVYRRHMDAVVEEYLSAPRYRTALAQFRKHMSSPEQQMRTGGAWKHYLRATEVVASHARDASGGGGTTSGPTVRSAGAFFNDAAAAGHESDWRRVGGTGVGGLSVGKGEEANGTDLSDEHALSSGADRYRLEKTDLELLAGDTARRARLLDDTLPWRPIDFDATGIRLEALENFQADASGGDAVAGAGGVAPAVGGSVNLLIEVLILTEMDVPFTSAIPMVNYTNVFLLLASLFVQSEVLLTKLIRFYRSVRAWEAEVDDTSRAIYLERRILQCILVYCRVHETDLTLSCLQRLAVFAASEGLLGPVNMLNDAVGKEQWPCQEGVYCASRRRISLCAQAAAASAAAGASPPSTTGPGSNGFGSLRHYKRHGFMEPRRVVDFGIAGFFPQRNATFDPNALLNPATRAPLQPQVAQTLLEFVVYLQRTIVVYYRPVEISAACRQSLPFALEGPPRVFIDSAVQRPGLGCTSSSLRTAVPAEPLLTPEPFAPIGGVSVSSLGARFGDHAPGSTVVPSSSNSLSRDQRNTSGAGLLVNRPYDGGGHGERNIISQGSVVAPPGGLRLDGHEPTAGWGNGGGGGAAAAGTESAGISRALTLETTVLQKPLSVLDIDSEHLSRQICLLSFSLFAAVHIRELLNNAWTDSSMKFSVSTKLTELMEFSAHLQRWTAAVIVTPGTWAECQHKLRYFLEVCRMLYEQQNYEMASAILEGLRHPAVEFVERAYAETRGQGLLSPVERRELETLQELMDPFASYSPSSLYSVTARTVGDMETPMIPLLSPILGVMFRSEDTKGSTVSIRSSDGQAVVNWSKVIGLGKMVVLWIRCQYTPFAFPVDPDIQEFLWSAMNHQWTDALLMRAARRAKQ